MIRNAVLKTVLAYYTVAVVILLSGYFAPARTEFVTYVPILLSVLLLVPLYMWQRNYRLRTGLLREISEKDKRSVIFCSLALFILALSVRIPSVLMMGIPYEKTPLIYLIVLTMLIIGKTDLSAFGFRTEKLGKSLLYGFAFFAVLGGLMSLVSYVLIYGFVNQVAVESYDAVSSMLSMPFMILCVGLSEEGLFRGYIQARLQKVCSLRTAILFQAFLFGLWHFVWNLSPFDPFVMTQYVLSTFLMGLLFGYFFAKTGSLVSLVFAHGLWDSVLPWIIEKKVTMDYFSTFPLSSQVLVAILPLVVAAAVTVLFVKYLVNRV
ncbi:CPBP family intramembrane metalloprotease [Candidatus Bathyarchaeota archaeon]|nr:CPBP family intramembrane metalloprotease [Candidatus Bathyarchaeota archaeon]